MHAIQGNIAIIIAEIIFYNQHQQILYIYMVFYIVVVIFHNLHVRSKIE